MRPWQEDHKWQEQYFDEKTLQVQGAIITVKEEEQ
jgi:hypothetical protein